jgi:hypothetical protein
MGATGMSIWHWTVVVTVFLLLSLGRGRISELVGNLAQGMRDDGPESSTLVLLLAAGLLLVLVMVAAFS